MRKLNDQRLISALMKGVGEVVREYVVAQIAPIERRLADLDSPTKQPKSLGLRPRGSATKAGGHDHIAPLQQRIADLEALIKGFHYCGVWEMNRNYELGNFVTFKGCLWHCNKPTTGRPGDGDSWTLAVKKGRDYRRDHERSDS